jgi:hypothetical protein
MMRGRFIPRHKVIAALIAHHGIAELSSLQYLNAVHVKPEQLRKAWKAVDELFLAKTPLLQFVGKSILTTCLLPSNFHFIESDHPPRRFF